MLLLSNATYTITMDRSNFKNVFEYISKIDMYEIIAYMLPIVLDINVLIIFIGAFTIIPVANNIM